jgi:hypothetical protein
VFAACPADVDRVRSISFGIKTGHTLTWLVWQAVAKRARVVLHKGAAFRSANAT